MSEIPFAPYIILGIFALVVGTTVAGALIAALSTRIIRGVTGLMICCMGIAGLYYFLNRPQPQRSALALCMPTTSVSPPCPSPRPTPRSLAG